MRGFTLIEVMIAITILAFLSYFTAVSIQNAVRDRARIQAQIETTSGLRSALEVIAHDVERAFHYRDLNIDMVNEAMEDRYKKKLEEQQKNQQKAGADAEPVAPLEKPTKREQVILTQFVGSENELHLTSRNQNRTQKNSPVGDVFEVGYTIKDCRNRVDKKKSSKCLWRRLNPYLDDDVTRGGAETALLENVQKFELRYLGEPNPEEWVDSWKSNEQGREETRGIFPTAVEATIEYQDKSVEDSKPLTMTRVALVRFPNNRKDKKEVEPPPTEKE